MTVVADTSFIVAALDAGDEHHAAAAALADEDFVTTPLALAEMDRVLAARAGVAGQKALWRNLDSGALVVRWWADALRETLRIARRDPGLDLAGASLVALATLLRTDRIATFDGRFRGATLPDRRRLTLLPE